MSEKVKFPLKGIKEKEGIKFIEAELSPKYDLPFAVVWYSLEGIKQAEGLRLDLDKEVFLDHPFADAEKKKFLQKAAREISEAIAHHLYPSHRASHG